MIQILYLGLFVLIIAGMWKTFAKAGRPGWACLIPFYNAYVACEIARLPILWFVLAILPFISIVAWVVICLHIARNFGKSDGFGIGLALLGCVFFPILGLGEAQYQGTAGIPQAQPLAPPAETPAQPQPTTTD